MKTKIEKKFYEIFPNVRRVMNSKQIEEAKKKKDRFTIKLDNVAGMSSDGGVILIDNEPYTYESIVVEKDYGIEFDKNVKPIVWHGEFKSNGRMRHTIHQLPNETGSKQARRGSYLR